MKRAVPVIIFFLLSGFPVVNGQFIGSTGLKAGVSLANQKYRFTPIEYTMETDPLACPAIAVFLEAFRQDHLSFQLDLAYLAKGSKTSTQSVTVNHLDRNRISITKGDLRVSNFHYLSLSPLARYRFGKEGIAPYALLGPRLDYLLKYTSDSEYPLEEQNKIIFGLCGGVGVEFIINNLGVFIEVQYQPDLSPVTSKDPLRVNNNIFFFTLGVRYLNTL